MCTTVVVRACVFRMEPLFLPVDIAAHTQWPCWLFFLLIEEIQAR